jgi:hypothetical protein
MKKYILILSLLNSISFASEIENVNCVTVLPNIVVTPETLSKDLKNPNLYKHHEILFTQQIKSKFLFFSYTKEVVLNKITFDGVDVNWFENLKQNYVKNISFKSEGESIVEDGVLNLGQSLIITKNKDNTNNQYLIFRDEKLISLDNIKVDNDVMIQLPKTSMVSFVTPLSDSFENIWKDSDGKTYTLKYTGKKIN